MYISSMGVTGKLRVTCNKMYLFQERRSNILIFKLLAYNCYILHDRVFLIPWGQIF